MSSSKVLVTGGTGKLGSLVVDRLKAIGCEVRVLSRTGCAGTVQGNLRTGEGLEHAVKGIDIIIHCASSPINPRQVDAEGTKRLIRAAEQAGVAHFVFISIVGIAHNPFFPYYAVKHEVERMIEQAAIPWTILRATQFHEFVLMLIRFLDHLPIMLIPKGLLIQPIETSEVADRLVELALSTPMGRVTDIGGPEALTAAEMARAYFKATGQKRRILEIPLPGKALRAFRTGVHLCPEQKCGKVRWEEFLHQRLNAKPMKGHVLMSNNPQIHVNNWVRFGVWSLAIVPLIIGFWAFFAPYHFYEMFPFPESNWLSTLGPYNEHLVRDYGANNLGFGVLFAMAAVFSGRQLVQVALISWLAFAIPHFSFHVMQTHHFSLFDNMMQLSSLGFVVVLPIILLFFMRAQTGYTARLMRPADSGFIASPDFSGPSERENIIGAQRGMMTGLSR